MGKDVSKAYEAGEKVSSSELFDLLKPRWDVRGPRFFVPDSKKRQKGAPMASRRFLILTHPEPVYVHKVAWGMPKVSKAWPNTELVRCTSRRFVEDGDDLRVEESGECAYCANLGKSFWGFFIRVLILDRVKTDEGVAVASGVSSFIVTQKMTKDAVLAMSMTLQDQGEDAGNMVGRVVKAFRGTADKSSSSGSQWNPVDFLPLAPGGAGVKKLREAGFSVDLLKAIFATIKTTGMDDCYPPEDRETQLKMIEFHIITGLRNPSVDGIEWDNTGETQAIVEKVEAMLAGRASKRKPERGAGSDVNEDDDDDVIGIDDIEASKKAASSFDDEDGDDEDGDEETAAADGAPSGDDEDWGGTVITVPTKPVSKARTVSPAKGSTAKGKAKGKAKDADTPDEDDNDIGL